MAPRAKPASKKKRRATRPATDTVLILRTCAADMTSHGGFKWPKSGPVECADWDPRPECGNGLHGLLWGEGTGALLNWDPDARWLVVEVPAGSTVDLAGKVKFPRGVVLYAGDRKAATDMIAARRPGAIVGAFVTGGDWATVTGGDGATVTGGDGATVTGGDGATVTGGYGATVTGGDGATVTGGDGATVTGGDGATVTGGDGAVLSLRWWDGKRYRIAVFYVGEDGIESGVAYRCENGKAVRATP